MLIPLHGGGAPHALLEVGAPIPWLLSSPISLLSSESRALLSKSSGTVILPPLAATLVPILPRPVLQLSPLQGLPSLLSGNTRAGGAMKADLLLAAGAPSEGGPGNVGITAPGVVRELTDQPALLSGAELLPDPPAASLLLLPLLLLSGCTAASVLMLGGTAGADADADAGGEETRAPSTGGGGCTVAPDEFVMVTPGTPLQPDNGDLLCCCCCGTADLVGIWYVLNDSTPVPAAPVLAPPDDTPAANGELGPPGDEPAENCGTRCLKLGPFSRGTGPAVPFPGRTTAAGAAPSPLLLLLDCL
jgi:hypothetical protein